MVKQKSSKFFTLFSIILGLSMIRGGGVYSKEVQKSEVCLYVGSGAELAKDVEFALGELGIAYGKLNEDDKKRGNLENCSVLIIPGSQLKVLFDTIYFLAKIAKGREGRNTWSNGNPTG